VPRLILAVVNPDNTPHGYNWTFAFPMLLFIIIGTILYLLFSRPHRRVPARGISLPARSRSVPAGGTARSASVAGGLSVAPGGSAESRLEPGGAHQAATGTGVVGGATAVGPPSADSDDSPEADDSTDTSEETE